MDESRYNMSILEVTIRVRSAMERDFYQPNLQVVMGSKDISGNGRSEVAAKLFLVRTVECDVKM